MSNGIERFSELRVLRWAERISDALLYPSGGWAETGTMTPPGPIRCNLDLENRCDHNCYFCEPAEYRKQTMADRRYTLETEKALEVLEDLKELDCRTVNFSGGGEPTLHPEFGAVLRRASELGFRTWVVTHGGHLERWMEELLLADHVRVSLDASCEEEHRQMHRAAAGEFARVVENIRSLAAARANRRDAETQRKPEIGIAYIVTDGNGSPESLGRSCELARDVGADFVHFRPISEDPGGPKLFTGDWNQVADTIEAMRADFPFLDIWPLAKRWKDVFYQREFENCYAAYTLAVVGANGDCHACCDRRDIVFGNVYRERFRDIWLGETHRRMAGRIEPRLCSRCLMCNWNRAVERYVVRDEALAGLV